MSNPTEILGVYSIDEETDDETLIGKVEYGSDGKLTLLEADADQADFLHNVVSTVNAKDQIVQKVPPPSSPEDAPAGSHEETAPIHTGEPPERPVVGTHSKTVSRSDEAFLPALNDYLLKYYGLSLS